MGTVGIAQAPQSIAPKDPEQAVELALATLPDDVAPEARQFIAEEVKEFTRWLADSERAVLATPAIWTSSCRSAAR
jgi:hypothetical protein